ncbi:AAA-domain-containing protein [Coprinellus micaceus]|uniref:AAA-domain-containing protein n=1 Tax=Coprinellus micaceus TaxID=71717 RepID=A0A4Y7T0A7_COPMI|nr:AAA-domain-containing protein [Coprinellus micaceus]
MVRITPKLCHRSLKSPSPLTITTGKATREFKIQVHDESEAQLRSARRILVNADLLKASKLNTGDVAAVSQNAKVFAVGVLWASTESLVTSLSVSTSHLLTLGLLEGQTVRILPLALTGPASRAPGIPSLKSAKDATDIRCSTPVLNRQYHTSAGRAKRDVMAELDRLSLNGNPQLWITGWDTNVQIINNPAPEPSSQKEEVIDYGYSSIGGLSKQIEEIRDLLEIPLTRPEFFRHFGTGKTHLARAIAASTKSSVLVINGPELSSAYHGETESRLPRDKSPCIVVLDEVDALVPRREEGAGGEVEKRVEEKDDSRGKVVVIGTTNRPNAIDPALRRPGRFDREIEIGIPDSKARLSIINVLLGKTPHTISQDDLRSLASRAHGAVVREAGTLAIKRWTKADDHTTHPMPDLQLQDLEAALPLVRASAMRSVFVEAPAVRYSDIGGQASVIQKLREAVEWPLLHPEAFQRLGVKPPKGVLLYGPPGCSKTVMARACACESGINFVAVKGPELLNKYVGESERGLREIFRKARAAAPSIIFFDEIDALASSRSSSGTDMGSSSEGVLTSLLNEMDGVQELVGVTVIAATNRPEAIDSALMRPGRLDRILYVGPPDAAGREEVIRIKLKRMTIGPDVDFKELAQLTEGCSGAEITSMCQEAALETMRQDINAPCVPHSAFVAAAKSTKTQITPAVLAKFAAWRAGVEVRHL